MPRTSSRARPGGGYRDTAPRYSDADLEPLLRALVAVRDGRARSELNVPGEGAVAEAAAILEEIRQSGQELASGLARVRREIGREGQLRGRLTPGTLRGTWAAAAEDTNAIIDKLTDLVTGMSQVVEAVAAGDLSQRVELRVRGRPMRGELLRMAKSVNGMVDLLDQFTWEVTQFAREVGTEGRLGGQAPARGMTGRWRDVTASVNVMASRLTSQVRDIAEVTTAVAKGDLTRKVTVEATGELQELKLTVNTMVDQLSAFADEVTRVAREVGTEGQLGGQANVPGVSGVWKNLTDNVNAMANNLTYQVRGIAQVTTAVAEGDLGKKITVDAQGEIAQLKDTVNTMVDTLSAFADEVTRVAREVGTEGRLGGQARVLGVSGVWKDLTNNVNGMASNLTFQVRNIAQVTTAVAEGDLGKKITVDAQGEILELKDTVNAMVDTLSAFASEVTRVAREVGTEGRLGGQAIVPGAGGVWKDLTDNVNSMANNLTNQVRGIAQVTTAVAQGDLTRKIEVDAQGEILQLKTTLNTMVDTLSAFADEVSRVAREVGTEGRLGGQAIVPGAGGMWKDLTDNVNGMASNLTYQVRNIAQVATAVAHGDLTRRIDVNAQGEILELKTTLNTMVDTLSSFASEVTRVAREVGIEGRLGGQAEVEGVSGTWKRLTESVNELAGNLTTQVRAIGEVASAVATGDLTRTITVEARGEVAELSDNVNLMVATLRETTRANEEQDWLKTNLARIGGLMQGHRDLQQVADLIMRELTPTASAQYGAFYLAENSGEETELSLIAGYGTRRRANRSHGDGDLRFALGEGLVGQAAQERRALLIADAPADYIKIGSGLGEASPVNIIVLPIVFEDEVLGAIELASFGRFTDVHLAFFSQLIETIGVTLNAIRANTRTEQLLGESQRLAQELQERSDELQRQQGELRHSNTELEEKAALLAQQNRAIEIQNFQIEQARRTLEERAEQLAISSRYKSEFLANMSHELRTPLNSLLVLAKLLSENQDGNLTGKQVEFAQTIHDSGTDLLELINDILDLAKVEAGKMEAHPHRITVSALVDYVDATFRPLSVDKGLQFGVDVAPDVPPTLITDEQRLQQVLRNLLSNAVKFTAEGEVRLLIERAGDIDFTLPALWNTPDVIAFRVIDTGIGVSADKLQEIFEPFQQADGTTSRRYGGTGLGLSISRNIARLLGGEIHAESRPGRGSVFTLYLPARYSERDGRRRAVTPEEDATPEGTPRNAARTGAAVPEETGPAAEERPPAGNRPGDAEALNGLLEDPPADLVDTVLSGRKVLIVDDDVRNVFALTSVLEGYGMDVLYAEDGQAGIDVLHRHPDVAVVLMDVMMPGLDGYATTAAIREMPQFAELPIIVITAKVMKGDREKSLESGASDYVPKPVDVDHLLDVMRNWLQPSIVR
ncbi:GAF sensor hybrid histidine kinase [Actinomadura pelletieri DSM 43383]|uniref:Circadian input-output histidine kinase CikA n=1 Tax=Actinomadura pelletieri DSM 43383 TaxID=1120940 RepID=A0A495QMJ9_9ACTN|nr:HAMP domain-containing protein [Actinomadura pelletieri]RKS74215.1 GAF sensor hybrid histidine kinase [Actinomadura pelletieri DSM 43383]